MLELAQAIRRRDRDAVARALNLVEDRRDDARAATSALLVELRTDEGHRVGLTGPPGVGKSTLAAALTRALRRRGRTVGIVAVDPSSVRSGGSLLGDRARMGFDPDDDGIFVRSFATGGDAGGLTSAALAAAAVLAAAYDVVLLETTGVGQTETDVRDVADTVALVVQPGGGDVLQFLKAGVMEIPDLLVVNKVDHGALADRAVADLRSALQTAQAVGAGAALPIVATSATAEQGIDALVTALDAHRHAIEAELPARRRRGEVAWAVALFRRRHGEHGVQTLGGAARLRELAEERLTEAAPPAACAALSERYLRAVCERGAGESPPSAGA